MSFIAINVIAPGHFLVAEPGTPVTLHSAGVTSMVRPWSYLDYVAIEAKPSLLSKGLTKIYGGAPQACRSEHIMMICHMQMLKRSRTGLF